jgi:hypothetical protein
MGITSFYLKKLYLDSIDEHGNCFVVYWANLKFSFFNIVYSGLIFSDAENLSYEKSSFRKFSKPENSDVIIFDNHSLKLQGTWHRQDSPVSILLFTDKNGNKLFWDCHHPKTSTSIVYKGRIYQGLGYAETLTLPIKPWKLPIDQLRWGRFLSHNHTIIWINWKGAYPLNKLIWNGQLIDDAIFKDSYITFDNGKSVLTFHEKSIIREGKLIKLLSKMPWLRIIFNSKILNTLEIKYKASTSFSRNHTVLEKGWSLFEIVTWKK